MVKIVNFVTYFITILKNKNLYIHKKYFIYIISIEITWQNNDFKIFFESFTEVTVRMRSEDNFYILRLWESHSSVHDY